MVKYFLAALALKAFSLNEFTKRTYRSIGNVVGQRARQNAGIEVYVERGNSFVALCKKYDAVPAQARAFELGTGWMHWYSLYLRLFFDLHITMLDVWDNRQLAALHTSFGKLKAAVAAGFAGDISRLDRIVAAPNFEALYEALGLCYVIKPDGSPRQFADSTFDLIFSFHVMEHVPIGNIEGLLADFHRILKPGGYMIHQVGIDDHLQHYDPAESPKNYLRYSDRAWKLMFENDLQYFNRLQACEWIDRISGAGFVLLERIAETADLGRLPIAPRFKHFRQEDLACTILTLVHQKPLLA